MSKFTLPFALICITLIDKTTYTYTPQRVDLLVYIHANRCKLGKVFALSKCFVRISCSLAIAEFSVKCLLCFVYFLFWRQRSWYNLTMEKCLFSIQILFIYYTFPKFLPCGGLLLIHNLVLPFHTKNAGTTWQWYSAYSHYAHWCGSFHFHQKGVAHCDKKVGHPGHIAFTLRIGSKITSFILGLKRKK